MALTTSFSSTYGIYYRTCQIYYKKCLKLYHTAVNNCLLFTYKKNYRSFREGVKSLRWIKRNYCEGKNKKRLPKR